MLSLWYIILGWKEYNKPFIKQERGTKPADPAPKKPDLIPKTPGPATDVRKPLPPAPPQVSKPTLPKDIPKTLETQKLPELPKGPPKIPERPKLPDSTKPSPPSLADVVKGVPDSPKPPPKIPDLPKPPSKAPDSPTLPDPSKGPKARDSPPKTPSRTLPKSPLTPDSSGFMVPSKRPDSVMPSFPPSGPKNPAPGPNQEFPLPPYLPGAPNKSKPPSKGDELFAVGSNRRNPDTNGARKPISDLRDLTYSRGELPPADGKTPQPPPSVPKYMEDSTVSNPDSLDSSGENEEEDDD